MFLTLLRRQARIAAEGVPVPGFITTCFRVKSGWVVRYQFRTKDGESARGSGQAASRLEAGTAVCVLYLPQNPNKNQMCPTNLYRVTQ